MVWAGTCSVVFYKLSCSCLLIAVFRVVVGCTLDSLLDIKGVIVFMVCIVCRSAKIVKATNRYTGARVVLKMFNKGLLSAVQLDDISKEIQVLKLTKQCVVLCRVVAAQVDTKPLLAIFTGTSALHCWGCLCEVCQCGSCHCGSLWLQCAGRC